MTVTESIITIAAVVAGTMLTRFLPFWVFPEGKKPPLYIEYLGSVLPYAVIGFLVVFCLKDSFQGGSHGLTELISIAFIILLHKWRKNVLLSICGGTAFYMFLVQRVFC